MHNLKGIDVDFPVGKFVCVTGVSGSGKSTLVNEILYKALANKLNRMRMKPGDHLGVAGIDVFDKVIDIDQTPIRRRLQTLHDVGLDYVKLGQPATTLSGGEAQRVKLAAELCKVATGKTLYILDEPTTGLHFADIEKLLEVLQRLVDAGNTVLVIEHNLDVIKQADWVIDLGPEGGEEGGYLMAAGTPEEVAGEPESATGRFLAALVEPAPAKPR